MTKLMIALLMLVGGATGQDFQQAKLLDVVASKQAGPSIVAPNNGNPIVIPTSEDMFTITVALDEMSYSAQYRETRHFKPSQLVVGDEIPARIDGDKLVLKTGNRKEMKAKIIRREW